MFVKTIYLKFVLTELQSLKWSFSDSLNFSRGFACSFSGRGSCRGCFVCLISRAFNCWWKLRCCWSFLCWWSFYCWRIFLPFNRVFFCRLRHHSRFNFIRRFLCGRWFHRGFCGICCLCSFFWCFFTCNDSTLCRLYTWSHKWSCYWLNPRHKVLDIHVDSRNILLSAFWINWQDREPRYYK